MGRIFIKIGMTVVTTVIILLSAGCSSLKTLPTMAQETDGVYYNPRLDMTRETRKAERLARQEEEASALAQKYLENPENQYNSEDISRYEPYDWRDYRFSTYSYFNPWFDPFWWTPFSTYVGWYAPARYNPWYWNFSIGFGFYGWYDPWYSPWYSPFYNPYWMYDYPYCGFYSPYWAWYDPWYYHPVWGGHYWSDYYPRKYNAPNRPSYSTSSNRPTYSGATDYYRSQNTRSSSGNTQQNSNRIYYNHQNSTESYRPQYQYTQPSSTPSPSYSSPSRSYSPSGSSGSLRRR